MPDQELPEQNDYNPEFNQAEFTKMVEHGTAAWKDVPADWLETIRGNLDEL